MAYINMVYRCGSGKACIGFYVRVHVMVCMGECVWECWCLCESACDGVYGRVHVLVFM